MAPNPANPRTTIRLAVPSPGDHVVLRIYNVQGQLIRSLVEGRLEPGYHTVTWDGLDRGGRTVASGVYFYEMRAARFREVRRLTVLR